MKNVKKYMPEYDDLVGAVEGLIRLQVIYKLKCDDFAKGIIDGKETGSELTAHDLFVIGEEASLIGKKEYFVKEYLDLAWQKIQLGLDVDKEVDVNRLFLILAQSYNRTGYFDNAFQVIDVLILKDPENKALADRRKEYFANFEKYGDSMIKVLDQNPFDEDFKRTGFYDRDKEQVIYSQVCREFLTKTPNETSQLKCHYDSKTPFARLAPFKVEEANLDPYIVLFIDVLSSAEADVLVELSGRKIKRALTASFTSDKVVSKSRIAQVAWHQDKDHPLIKKMSQRLEVSFKQILKQ